MQMTTHFESVIASTRSIRVQHCLTSLLYLHQPGTLLKLVHIVGPRHVMGRCVRACGVMHFSCVCCLAGKVAVFHLTKAALALLSAVTEALLYR